MSVHIKVRDYIDGQGLKQAAVAQKAEIPVALFNDILNGKKTMRIDDLRAVCFALNVSPEVFIEVRYA